MFNFGEKFIERFFLDLIKDFAGSDIANAVYDDISLLDITKDNNPRLLGLGAKMASKFNGYSYLLTTDNVIGWLEEKRPDFYIAIKLSKKHYEWLDRNVKEIKTFLFGM